MIDSQKPHFLPYLSLGVGVISLGLAAIFVRWADAPGPVTSFYRLAIAVTLLACPFYRRVKVGERVPLRGLKIAVLGGLFFAGNLAFWASGVVLSGATSPTLLLNTAPLWVGLGALILFRERLSITFWHGLALAMAGALVVLGIDSWRDLSFGFGTLLGLLAGIFQAGYFLVTQRGRQILDSLTYFWLASVSSTLVLLIVSLALHQPLTGYSLPTYLNFVALGLITQICGHFSINYALGYLPASIVSPTLLGQPIVTAILAGPLLGERLSAWQIVGGALVLAGVFTIHRSQHGKSGRRNNSLGMDIVESN
jgi:drug/metabolite transporter (DMT)-like permease